MDPRLRGRYLKVFFDIRKKKKHRKWYCEVLLFCQRYTMDDYIFVRCSFTDRRYHSRAAPGRSYPPVSSRTVRHPLGNFKNQGRFSQFMPVLSLHLGWWTKHPSSRKIKMYLSWSIHWSGWCKLYVTSQESKDFLKFKREAKLRRCGRNRGGL